MGKLTAHRNFLLNLFPEAFHHHMPDGSHFDVLIIDLMQFIAKVKFNRQPHESEDDCVNARDLAFSTRRVVEFYMNEERSPLRPQIDDLIVLLLDTPGQVPRNKARTQRQRDQPAQQPQEEATDESQEILNEKEYEAFAELYDLEAMQYLMVSDPFVCPFPGQTVWRSNNLKLQLYRTLTHELLQIKLREGQLLLLDDGIAVEDATFVAERRKMIEDYGFSERSGFAKECLVTTLMSKWFVNRLLLYPDGMVKRFPCTGIGEADVKLCRYIKANDRRRRSHLVVSQDTDVIFILLLHMKRLINAETGLIDEDVQVFIDTQTPQARNANQNTAYRFIDVKALYYALLALFEREYPSVQHPIETYCFLVYSLETDFTSGFHSYLGISERLVWDTFSALHSGRADGSYLQFDDKLKKDEVAPVEKKRKVTPKKQISDFLCVEHRYLLADAIQCQEAYDEETGDLFYRTSVDSGSVSTFLYLLAQQKLKRELIQMGNARLTNEPTYFIPVDVALAMARDIEQKVRQLKMKEGEQKTRILCALAQTGGDKSRKKTLVQCSSSIVQKPLRLGLTGSATASPREDIEEIEEPSEEALLQAKRLHIEMRSSQMAQQGRLQTLAKAKTVIPANFGIPEEAEMLARVQRTQWLLQYSQNGWIHEKHALNFGESALLDPTLSLWGWRLLERTQNEESFANGDMNSGYLWHRFHEQGAGLVPVKLYRVEESDRISRPF